MEWPAHLPLVGGGGCVNVVSEQVVYNNLGHEERWYHAGWYQSISIGNHAYLSSKYIHMRCFKVLNS